MIAAILLAQWRSMRTFRTGGARATAFVSWISGLLFYGFWAAAAFGAQAFFRNPGNSRLFPLVLSGVLFVMMLYWQITPVITASMGASLDLKKLLAYPIPHRTLFIVELLLRVLTCAEMIVVLSGIVIGLARNPETGGWLHVPGLIAVALLVIALNILLSAAIRSLLERFLLRKRMKELMMFLIVLISVGPQILLMKGFRLRDLDTKQFPDAPYLPWSAASHLLLGTSYAIPLLTLTALLFAVYFLARWQFEINLLVDGSGSGSRPAPKTERSARFEPLFRWPALVFPDPLAAIMEKELRSLLRTPQFRFIFFMGAAFGLVMYVPQLMNGRSHPNSFFSQNLLTFCCVYGILLLGQVSYFNCFGYDRSAVQAWFSYPVAFAETLIAKNLAALTFILVEIGMVTLTAALFRIQIRPGKLAESIVVTLIAAMYMMAFGNVASVWMPRPLNPTQISQWGSAKALNAIVLVCTPIVLLPIVLSYWARSVFQSDAIFFSMIALSAVFGALLYGMGLHSAVGAAGSRREKILTDLSRGEGPLSA